MKTNEYIEAVNNKLSIYLDFESPEVIGEAMRYSVFAGGKRVRPLLCLLSAHAFGGQPENCLPFACALEMIHAYSLIHDDLPAMDDDDFRRGKPTNHKVFGEAMAILSGDALLNTAFEIMTEGALALSGFLGIKAMSHIARAAGVRGMIGGQVADILSEGKEISAERLNYIHENKTAALIRASLLSGAVLGGASEAEVLSVEKAGYCLGMAFQIKDDLLDLQSNFETLGKPIGSDMKNNKSTYVSIHGVDKSQKDYLEYSSECIKLLLNLNLKNNDIIEYIKSLTDRIS